MRVIFQVLRFLYGFYYDSRAFFMGHHASRGTSEVQRVNAIFRFHAVGFRVEIEKCISFDSVQKRREADDNFKFMKYVVQGNNTFFQIFREKCE